MRTYSEDLRQRVVQACDEGELNRQEIADVFGVSTAWIRRLLQRRRERGSISALVGGRGAKPVINEKQLLRLKSLVEKDPGLTLAELKKRLRVDCCLKTIHNALKSLGLTYKKQKRYVPVNKSAPT